MTDASTGPTHRPTDDTTAPDSEAPTGREGTATGRGDAMAAGGDVVAGRGEKATGRGDAAASGGDAVVGREGTATGRGDVLDSGDDVVVGRERTATGRGDATASGGDVVVGREEKATERGDVPAGPAEASRGDGREVPGAAGLVAGGGSGRERAEAGRGGRLLPHEECGRLERRLRHAVSGFVDEPRAAVEEADRAVEELGARVTEAVERRRRTLRGSWRSGGAADTEQLRLALRDYRELADRLLSL
ncbi:hypothetical protein AB0M32_33280 [Streptomyces sp. NPDC051985]|uniref:hypothetical protein n=1 Tax=Streptomyces sp. NPDC051985 TaxID=3155807 RepID=UPI0034291337